MFRIALLSLALSACHDPGVVVGELNNTIVIKAIPNRDLDLLFVIDDSSSMADKQAALVDAFPKMIDVLSQLDGGLPNLHIGVITSDMGTSSRNSSPAGAIGVPGYGGCSDAGKDGALRLGEVVTTDGMPFLVDVDAGNGTRERNYTGALRDVFGEAALVGIGGCGFEQHLAATSRALVNPANAGFLRPEANLGVVYLVDEDDCSAGNASLFEPSSPTLGALDSFRCFRFGVTCAEDTNTFGDKTDCGPAPDGHVAGIEAFVDELLAAKSDERMVMVGVIGGATEFVAVEPRMTGVGGATEPALNYSCTYPGAMGPTVATPGIRLEAFADSFDGRGTFTTVCGPDLTPALDQIGESAKGLMGNPCLDSAQLADVDPATPGVQPSCEVVDIADSAPSTERSLAACSSGEADCYEIVADATACPATSDNLRVRMHRATAVSADTWTYVRCKRSQ